MEAGKLIFTDVGDDKETGQLCIVCAMPVYGKDGKLLAVAGSDFFLTEIQEAVESVSGDGEFFGISRLMEALEPAVKGTPKDVLFSVRQAVNTFADQAEQFDDLTMLCLEYKGTTLE